MLELGRAARLVERVIFLGAMAGFFYYGGLPLGSLEKVGGLTDHIFDEMIPRARGLIWTKSGPTSGLANVKASS
ncbi:MAG: hypothetical protein WA639_15265 [Candidatus Acidiferrum sp.]